MEENEIAKEEVPINHDPVIIITRVLSVSVLPGEIVQLLISQYKIQKVAADKMVENYLKPFLHHLKPDLYAVIELPYVDKLYRDSYYIFYASKLANHYRDCMRISFFDKQVKEIDFRNKDKHKELHSAYRGYLVIRPTFPKLIGRTAISPLAVRKPSFACCYTGLNATVLSNKYKVAAFPHSSQDGLTITCAETTIWGILEYFSNQYPEYKPVLPSAISTIIHRISFKRSFPSEGLTAEQVTYAIRELGFGSMIYSRKKYGHEFNSIVSTYIESGIPVIGVLKNRKGNIGHAVNIIGRQLDDNDVIINHVTHEKTKDGGFIIDHSRIDRNYVYMDDNFPPYQLAKLDNPCNDYFTDPVEKENWKEVTLTHIIVPLYSKIYLEAFIAKKNFLKALNSKGLGDEVSLKITDTRILRCFLASSRSFKEHISLYSELPELTRAMILAIPMPKFIWVAEISTRESFTKGMCDGVLVQDATEPGEFNSKTQPLMHSLILGFYEKVIFSQNFGVFSVIDDTFDSPFQSYRNNLNALTA